MQHLHAPLSSDVDQPCPAEPTEEASSEAPVKAVIGHESRDAHVHLEEHFTGVRGRARRQRIGVELLRHEPPTWFERGHELLEHLRPLAKVNEYEPNVDQIERGLRQPGGDDVMPPDLEVRYR